MRRDPGGRLVKFTVLHHCSNCMEQAPSWPKRDAELFHIIIAQQREITDANLAFLEHRHQMFEVDPRQAFSKSERHLDLRPKR